MLIRKIKQERDQEFICRPVNLVSLLVFVQFVVNLNVLNLFMVYSEVRNIWRGLYLCRHVERFFWLFATLVISTCLFWHLAWWLFNSLYIRYWFIYLFTLSYSIVISFSSKMLIMCLVKFRANMLLETELGFQTRFQFSSIILNRIANLIYSTAKLKVWQTGSKPIPVFGKYHRP